MRKVFLIILSAVISFAAASVITSDVRDFLAVEFFGGLLVMNLFGVFAETKESI